jgi:uncharacterized coiled-coil protein SlyX
VRVLNEGFNSKGAKEEREGRKEMRIGEGEVMDEMLAVGFAESVERLSAAAVALEQVVERLAEKQARFTASAEETVGRIVATVESAREAELERKLADAEQTIAELRASSVAGGRKTVVSGSLVAKAAEASDISALDGALASLSVEQRFAVKAEMLRSGLLR